MIHNTTGMPADEGHLARIIELAFMEDSGLGDPTSEAIIPPSLDGSAEVLCKESGTLAGLQAAALAFRICDENLRFRPLVADGAAVTPGVVAGVVEGSVRSILRAERVALNILQRMSGIASLTAQYVEAVRGTRAKICDTRKTAPGLRVIDKWAVRLGGGVNHRFGLDDMILIKDNHIAAAGGIASALRTCNAWMERKGLKLPVELEARSVEDVREALLCGGFHRIMLDNLSVEKMREAVAFIGGRVEVEASGGITLLTVRSVAETGVDLISVGALTHSPRALDISLELRHSSGPHA
jgi:nicotinate-nucleotide pyrophosphorylase (carboxylating)